MPSILEIIACLCAFFALCAFIKNKVWPHVPILPGLFEDMNNGWSYDREGNRIHGD